ncbi:MAG: hypothetical protein FWB72_04050 [Firmicutes bacterium]|nr:hypothetical protein [Bacillota bacterium]
MDNKDFNQGGSGENKQQKEIKIMPPRFLPEKPRNSSKVLVYIGIFIAIVSVVFLFAGLVVIQDNIGGRGSNWVLAVYFLSLFLAISIILIIIILYLILLELERRR